MAALAAASETMKVVGENQQAKVQDQMYNENAYQARLAASNQMMDLDARSREETSAASARAFDKRAETRAAIAAARVAAGASGAGGASVGALLGDLSAQGFRGQDRIVQNAEMTQGQLQREKLGVEANAQQRINSVERGSHNTLLGSVLRIGTAGGSAFASTSYGQNAITKTGYKMGFKGGK